MMAKPAPAVPPVELSNGIKSGNLAAVAHVKGPARVNKSKSHMTSFVLLFLSFLLLGTNAAANNGMGLQREITNDAPNTFIAKTIASLNDIVTRNYLRTRTIEIDVSINSSTKNIDHTNINNSGGKTKSDNSDALASEDKRYANEKENTEGGLRYLVSYNSVVS